MLVVDPTQFATITLNTFTGYASSDGVAWTTIGSITIVMPTGILAGLALTSHNSNLISTATFNNVTLA